MKTKAPNNPKKSKKESKKVDAVLLKPENKKIKKRRKESFSIYVYKVLRQVHPNVGISSRAMAIMNSFVKDMLERLANEAGVLLKKMHGKTLSGRDIQMAAKMMMPGELGGHSISEALKAIQLYVKNKNEEE